MSQINLYDKCKHITEMIGVDLDLKCHIEVVNLLTKLSKDKLGCKGDGYCQGSCPSYRLLECHYDWPDCIKYSEVLFQNLTDFFKTKITSPLKSILNVQRVCTCLLLLLILYLYLYQNLKLIFTNWTFSYRRYIFLYLYTNIVGL